MELEVERESEPEADPESEPEAGQREWEAGSRVTLADSALADVRTPLGLEAEPQAE